MTAPVHPIAPVVAENLTVRLGGAAVLDRVSFRVEPGDYIGIVGPNGSGKTTLIRALLGLSPTPEGRLELFGEPAASFRQWRRIGYLPQTTTPPMPRFPATVEEIVACGRLAHAGGAVRLSAEDRAAIDRALAAADISGLRRTPIGSLSGGQRQRVFVARALAAEPELLLLDEPTVALDPVYRDDFYRTLGLWNRERRTTIMLVTHDSATIGHHASKLLYLDRSLVFFGSFADFCSSPAMTQRFGEFQQHMVCHQHGCPGGLGPQ